MLTFTPVVRRNKTIKVIRVYRKSECVGCIRKIAKDWQYFGTGGVAGGKSYKQLSTCKNNLQLWEEFL